MNIAEELEPKEQSQALIPLPSGLPAVAPFDPEMLPDGIRDYVMDVAYRLQCAPDFCAVAALVCLSGLLGRKVQIRPKKHDDWIMPPNLWGVLIGGPSSTKSPALSAMRLPLDEIERELKKQHCTVLQDLKIEAEIQNLERNELQNRAKKLIREGNKEAAKEVLEACANAETPPPPLPRLIVNDTTVEALGERLNENPNGLLLVRDELAGLLTKMQQEEYASDRAFYLECYNGIGRYTTDRIGRGTIVIENCLLSIIGGIQPSKIAPIVRTAAKGTNDDGLIQRLQLAVYPDQKKDWQWVDQQPNSRAKEQYHNTFLRLQDLPTIAPDEEPPCWPFSDRAQEMFIEWMREVQSDARSGKLLPIMEAHLLKMPKTVCALALLFAVIDGQQGVVDERSTARALEWADYLRTHAERLYSAATCADVEAAKVILNKRDQLPTPFTLRDVYRKGWVGLDSPESTRDAIEVLLDHHYLFASDQTTEGRTKTVYRWRHNGGQ